MSTEIMPEDSTFSLTRFFAGEEEGGVMYQLTQLVGRYRGEFTCINSEQAGILVTVLEDELFSPKEQE